MPKVVSNTTPLISLLKLSKLELLKELYGTIIIPTAVFCEIEAGKEKEYYCDLSKIDWIEILKIRDPQAVKYFLELDAGEAEAIVLATEQNAELLILDEKLGRHYAKHAGLSTTGTIGVLVKAKKEGLIKELQPLLIELTQKNVWLSKSLIGEILKEAGER